MKGQKRIRDYGISIGELQPGRLNAISDVKAVRVGHRTLDNTSIKTGVSVIIPGKGDVFKEKLPAAVHVINGFGKSSGLIQVRELGTIETPVVLTNTFAVGTSLNALVRYMLEENEDIGDRTGTVNPLVFECNDGYLNDIRGMHVREEHVREALLAAGTEFEEGGVGAGMGMSCYKLKGGIGSASRVFELDGNEHALGVLVLTNMGRLRELQVVGRPIGRQIIAERYNGDSREEGEEDKGSVIAVVASDVPLSSRQLWRIARRVEAGIVRTGNNISSGSGEIVLAFSTAQRIQHYEKNDIVGMRVLNEEKMDTLFQAVAEASEEAVLNSLVTADACKGRDGHTRRSLRGDM